VRWARKKCSHLFSHARGSSAPSNVGKDSFWKRGYAVAVQVALVVPRSTAAVGVGTTVGVAVVVVRRWRCTERR
jgi:hypothetical protein